MPTRFRRILVCLDDTPAGAAALDVGLQLAADEGATVVVAHVVTAVGEDFVPDGNVPERVPGSGTTALLRTALERARDAGVEASTELLSGYPPKQLALLADELDADLLVVGARRLSTLQRVVLGSTSRALLSETRRPTLVVPVPVPAGAPAGVSESA